MSTLFKTIIDQEHVHSLLVSIQQATGIPVSLLGENGEFLASSGWNDLCRMYHSQTGLGQQQCISTRNFFAEAFADSADGPPDTPLEKNCQNGLIEIGLPVIVEGRHYATLVFGQFMPEDPDLDKFHRQAVAMGFEPDVYLRAVSTAPVIDRAVVEKLLGVYSGVIDTLVRIGLQHLEQQQAAEVIRASEEKFKALFDNSNDAIYIIDLKGTILEANRMACVRLGYDYEQLCSMHVSELGDASHMLEVDGRLKRFKREGRLDFETNHRCSDGTLIPVEVTGKVIDYGDDEAILCTARDLRRRYAAQRALKQSEEQFRSIIHSAPMGVLLYRCDDAGRLLLVGSNPSADEVLGIKTAEKLGMTLEEAFPALVGTDLPEIFRRVCRDGERWFSEALDYRDGAVNGVFESHAFQTAPNMMAVFFVDVTERIRSEQALRESEEKYRLLFSAEKDAILICDDQTLALTDANDAAVTLYGYSQEQLVELNVTALLAEPDAVREDLDSILSGSRELLSASHRHKSGALFPVEITAGVFNWTGRRMLVLIIRDTSEREKINRMKDEMLSSVSHEMRTPLTAMLGYTELMLKASHAEEQRQHFLKTTYREGERLRELIDDILDLQRMRAGFVGNQVDRVDISLLLQEVASLFNETSQDHSIALDCSPDIGLLVGDGGKILRALKNLVTNAIKYSPDGCEIRISARRIEPDRMVRISVQDAGLGIPEDAREHLFDRFFRVCQPEVKNLSGAGIGLSLVREIAKMHGGSIWFDSVPGEGSTFNLDLPIDGVPLCQREGEELMATKGGQR